MAVYNHWLAKHECYVCKLVYDPQVGDEAQGVPPETPLQKLPEHWRCECGVSKRMYQVLPPE